MKKYKAPSYPPVGSGITNPFANLPTLAQLQLDKPENQLTREAWYKQNPPKKRRK